MLSIQSQRRAIAIIGLLMATDASAKDVSGVFVGAFILSGGVVGLIVGVASPFFKKVRFLRGGCLAAVLSLLPWASLLYHWNFPFPDKTLVGNFPFMLLVFVGTVPVYLIAYGLVWAIIPKNQPHSQEPHAL